MDVLSQVLRSLMMEGSLYFPTEFTAPFGLHVPADGDVCRFHIVTRGHCWVTVDGGDEGAMLSQGDFALVPHGSAHRLQDAPATPSRRLDEALRESGYPGEGLFRWGGGGPVSHLVCGYFRFGPDAFHPMLAAMPRLVHVRASRGYDFAWIESAIRWMGHEASSEALGSSLIADRLSEILFVQTMRYLADTEPESVPILAGMADPRIGRALTALHAEVERSWSLAELAEAAAMSRTTFADRFRELMGHTPGQYVTHVRLEQARRLLAEDVDIATVAERVGYRSEAAFARKFKEVLGTTPGVYRRRHRR